MRFTDATYQKLCHWDEGLSQTYVYNISSLSQANTILRRTNRIPMVILWGTSVGFVIYFNESLKRSKKQETYGTDIIITNSLWQCCLCLGTERQHDRDGGACSSLDLHLVRWSPSSRSNPALLTFSGCLASDCCEMKEVGGINYKLSHTAEETFGNCYDTCIYTLEQVGFHVLWGIWWDISFDWVEQNW